MKTKTFKRLYSAPECDSFMLAQAQFLCQSEFSNEGLGEEFDVERL